MSDFVLPPVGFGPGSQPTPEGELDYLPMPQDMRTYLPRVPEAERGEDLPATLALLDTLAADCSAAAEGQTPPARDMSGLAEGPRRLIAETLGEGEVAAKLFGVPAVAVQEAVFAGVWALKGAGLDAVEVAPVPALVYDRAFQPRVPRHPGGGPRAEGVVNAPALLVELEDKSAHYAPGEAAHVVNLSLLPHTEADLVWLDTALGRGSAEILSRGYGNCRVTATALPFVWRVQFFNSMDTLILDTIEVTLLPEVVRAAPEDLADSARRLVEVREALA